MKKKTKEQFISEAVLIHGDKYDYSKFNYQNAHYKSIIICPEHGEFWQTPHEHISGKQGCPICGREKLIKSQTDTKEIFIKKARQIHGYKYDYFRVEYTNSQTKVCIICPKHGEFWQAPYSHLAHHECPKCARNYCRLNYNTFVDKANKKHFNKYQYPYFEYRNNLEYVDIICPEHGIFKQKIKTHLEGCGCPKCNKSSIEDDVRTYLIKNNINFTEQQKFDWLKYKKPLKLDFYLIDYNIGIECQGPQHYKSIKYFGGEEKLSIITKRDNIKNELCKEHDIKILYYTNKKFFSECKIKTIYTDLDLLISENMSINILSKNE